ncbi:tail protein X [Caulobacter segnis]|uniref:Phage tail protein n=1 Tax=Caulobacter segnis TaxID=88688 RepID=A0A2W5VBM1_9CAUL|nr:tail protein X [Caulobacter segnis]PZR37170.1 MAG: phage tail protein [Caulobacter segnis]
MATLVVHARAGETLDAVVHRAIGRTEGVVEDVLAANPGAAAFTRLPEGMAIIITDEAQAAPIADLIDLWS